MMDGRNVNQEIGFQEIGGRINVIAAVSASDVMRAWEGRPSPSMTMIRPTQELEPGSDDLMVRESQLRYMRRYLEWLKNQGDMGYSKGRNMLEKVEQRIGEVIDETEGGSMLTALDQECDPTQVGEDIREENSLVNLGAMAMVLKGMSITGYSARGFGNAEKQLLEAYVGIVLQNNPGPEERRLLREKAPSIVEQIEASFRLPAPDRGGQRRVEMLPTEEEARGGGDEVGRMLTWLERRHEVAEHDPVLTRAERVRQISDYRLVTDGVRRANGREQFDVSETKVVNVEQKTGGESRVVSRIKLGDKSEAMFDPAKMMVALECAEVTDVDQKMVEVRYPHLKGNPPKLVAVTKLVLTEEEFTKLGTVVARQLMMVRPGLHVTSQLPVEPETIAVESSNPVDYEAFSTKVLEFAQIAGGGFDVVGDVVKMTMGLMEKDEAVARFFLGPETYEFRTRAEKTRAVVELMARVMMSQRTGGLAAEEDSAQLVTALAAGKFSGKLGWSSGERRLVSGGVQDDQLNLSDEIVKVLCLHLKELREQQVETMVVSTDEALAKVNMLSVSDAVVSEGGTAVVTSGGEDGVSAQVGGGDAVIDKPMVVPDKDKKTEKQRFSVPCYGVRLGMVDASSSGWNSVAMETRSGGAIILGQTFDRKSDNPALVFGQYVTYGPDMPFNEWGGHPYVSNDHVEARTTVKSGPAGDGRQVVVEEVRYVDGQEVKKSREISLEEGQMLLRAELDGPFGVFADVNVVPREQYLRDDISESDMVGSDKAQVIAKSRVALHPQSSKSVAGAALMVVRPGDLVVSHHVRRGEWLGNTERTRGHSDQGRQVMVYRVVRSQGQLKLMSMDLRSGNEDSNGLLLNESGDLDWELGMIGRKHIDRVRQRVKQLGSRVVEESQRWK